MHRISPSQAKFIEEGVRQDLRTDGRGRVDYRPLTIETSVVPQANGSARARVAGTDVVVGVKVELGEPDVTTPDDGRVLFSVDCCPSASPEFDSYKTDTLNIELARAMSRLIGNAGLDTKALCILPGKQCWIVYVDALVMDSDGNLFDAISIATRAALYSTKIPKISLVPGELPGETDIEIADDMEDCDKIDIENVPICVTLTKIGQHFVVDASLEEELCMGARVTVGISPKGTVCGLQKGGKGGLPPKMLTSMLETAQHVGMSVIAKMSVALKQEEKIRAAAMRF
ncbi:ribosomal protein S5 domain 2-type protein [Pelomyxa schiedti]|nr:ribosomal protein S5 domain 2-type protein [Pelomyxa schiedti]